MEDNSLKVEKARGGVVEAGGGVGGGGGGNGRQYFEGRKRRGMEDNSLKANKTPTKGGGGGRQTMDTILHMTSLPQQYHFRHTPFPKVMAIVLSCSMNRHQLRLRLGVVFSRDFTIAVWVCLCVGMIA